MRWIALSLAVAELVLLSGCSKFEARDAETPTLPNAYGVYLQQGGKWLELSEPKSNIELWVQADTRFLLHDKRVGMQSNSTLTLTREHFVRNLISQDPGGSFRTEKPENNWQVSNDAPLPLQSFPVNGKPEMVILKPRGPMPTGVYQVLAMGRIMESIAVGAPAVFQEPARQSHCVDIVRSLAFGGIPMGISDKIEACAAPTTSAGSPTPSATLSAGWFGRWQTADGKRIVHITANAVRIIDHNDASPSNPGPSMSEMRWTANARLGEGQFHSLNAITNANEISQRYDTAVTERNSDRPDFAISDPASSGKAIASLSPGQHSVIHGYLGGDCAQWDWVLDGKRMLERQDCKYLHHIRLLHKIDEL